MLEKKDIEEAKKLFQEWDNDQTWHEPSSAFLEHSKKKAKQSLALAIYLLEKLTATKELEDNDIVTMWIIAQSYYSMFFEVEYLLALDGKKLPEGTQDTHKTIYLAFVYYYVIKGSELDKKNIQQLPKQLTTTRMSRALALFKELQDEAVELQRIEKSARDLKTQREQRHNFTYRMSRTAEIEEAKKSIEKATEFRGLIEEYILARQR